MTLDTHPRLCFHGHSGRWSIVRASLSAGPQHFCFAYGFGSQSDGWHRFRPFLRKVLDQSTTLFLHVGKHQPDSIMPVVQTAGVNELVDDDHLLLALRCLGELARKKNATNWMPSARLLKLFTAVSTGTVQPEALLNTVSCPVFLIRFNHGAGIFKILSMTKERTMRAVAATH